MSNTGNYSKEKLVVEVVAAHNLMPKDGEGSSSPFVEVEFENQRLRTQVRYKDLNPIWNEKLVFHVKDVADLLYRTVEINVFNERRSSNSRNFLGKVRVSGSSIAKEGEEIVQLYTLDKRSLFSHIRGEISLKLYLSLKEDVLVSPFPESLEAEELAGGGGGGVNMHSNVSSEFSLKETRPQLGGESMQKDKTSSTYDLVEQMQYLYVRVVKAREISLFGGAELVAEVKLGNYRGITKRVSLSNVAWDQVFAFSKDSIQSSMAEIIVKESNKDDFLGRVWFDLNEVPRRAPPDSQLAPQWYRLEDKKGEKAKAGEVMVSIWFGTQADEAFTEAWHSKAANVNFDGLCSINSKVYLSPKLWYLRVSVIEAQDIVIGDKVSGMMRFPELSAKAQVGNQVLRTRIAAASANRSLSNPYWNEEMVFVVAEPFEDYCWFGRGPGCAGEGRHCGEISTSSDGH
ncbi:Multiple C2 and transmembrane domain-containing protein 1 [Morella rubra]|uniref:Multiple C2 and transmembrane domain-containing protein 1 n=1 Tax=Morella rubra TaxID=262757 RepID=A0A6A1VBV1_9ROSI|nr:Multiple C2 and transmembrane domain-containing protein 1 [Morella rubra]